MTPLEPTRPAALVVVLGPLAASPRITRHAGALAASGYDVEILGYGPAPASLSATTRVRLLPSPPSFGSRGSIRRILLQGLWRSLVQPVGLLRALLRTRPSADVLLVQIPPSLPTLIVAAIVGRLRGMRVVADWHNFGSSMLALETSGGNVLVRLHRWYERVAARPIDGHLCVSNAMLLVLRDEWGLAPVSVVYDRPAEVFRNACAPEDRASLISSLDPVGGPDGPAAPTLVVTSTSWTGDEDMALALEALRRVDQYLVSESDNEGGPLLDFVVTGRGAGRGGWEALVRSAELRRVRVLAGWLTLDEYASLLAAADLGICLHRSTSGVDLPMKIVDMHGAGLPAAALDYGPCLRESLVEGEEALTFCGVEGLASVLTSLLVGGDAATANVSIARARLSAERGDSWLQRWQREALPPLRGDG